MQIHPQLETSFGAGDLFWRGGSFEPEPGRTPELLCGKTLTAVRGRFSLALATGEDGVVLVRDHLGLNKLFFALHEERRVVTANHAIDLVRRGVPMEAIYSVPAGHRVRVDVRRRLLALERFAAATPTRILELDDAAAAIRRELDQWLSRLARAFAGRRVCVCLSGGVDSSVITALARRHFADLTAYTYVFTGDGGTSDDAVHAETVAAAVGVPLRLVPASPEDLLQAVDDALVDGQDWRDFNLHCAVVNEVLARAIRGDAAPVHERPAHEIERDSTAVPPDAPLVLTGDLMNEFMADYATVSYGGRDYYRGPRVPAAEQRAALVRGLDAGDREVGVFSRQGAQVVQPYGLMFERYLELPADLLDRPDGKQELFRRVAGDLVPPSVFTRRKVRAQIGNADHPVGVLPLLAERGYDAAWLRRRFCRLFGIADESFLSRFIRLGRYRFLTDFPSEGSVDGYYAGTGRRPDRGLRSPRVQHQVG
jgi:asparagine synthetase B (glutamine-hydrolysing)